MFKSTYSKYISHFQNHTQNEILSNINCKIYIPVKKKKDHNLTLCIPNCQKSWKKNRRKKFKYVIHFHSSIDLHVVATQGELLGTCLCNILDLSPFIFRWTSDCEQIFWSNTTISWCSDQALFFFPRLGTSGANSLYWICNYKKNTLIPKCNQIYSIFPTILKLIQKWWSSRWHCNTYIAFKITHFPTTYQ